MPILRINNQAQVNIVNGTVIAYADFYNGANLAQFSLQNTDLNNRVRVTFTTDVDTPVFYQHTLDPGEIIYNETLTNTTAVVGNVTVRIENVMNANLGDKSPLIFRVNESAIVIPDTSSTNFLEAGGSSETSFSVTAEGTGSFTGLSYTIPAHINGRLQAKINMMALTSENIQKLNDLAAAMLSASVKEKIEDETKFSSKANLSFWSFFSGGAEADYSSTHKKMKSSGLTENQITTLMENMFEIAKNMNHIVLDFQIDNTKNDYSVSGDLQLYTISGQIKTDKGTREFRMLADTGTAGNGTAPAKGKIIPMN